MFCSSCGRELKDTDKFCVGCGMPVAKPEVLTAPPVASPVEAPVAPSAAPEAPVVPPVYTAPVATPAYPYGMPVSDPAAPDAKKKKSPLLPILIIAAAASVLLIVALVLVLVLNRDSAVVARALSKSAYAHSQAVQDLELPDVTALEAEQAYRQDLSLWVESLDSMPELEGLGLQLTTNYSQEDRYLGIELTPYYGVVNILNAQVQLRDNELYVYVPDLNDDTAYMVDTESIGSMLTNLGVEDTGLEGLSFNYFELIEQVAAAQPDSDVTQALTDSITDLAKTIEVEKTGKETITVNDYDVKCKVYHVTVPQDTLEELADIIEDLYSETAPTDTYQDIFSSMGLPQELIDEMMYSLEEAESERDYAFDGLREALDMLGDLELDLYLNDGYVMAVMYEDSVDGTDLEVVMNLGGGENYVDDIGVQIVVDDEMEIFVRSSGDHSGESGAFTDKTVVDVVEYGSKYRAMDMRTSYDPKASEDNFSWSIEIDEYASIAIHGNVQGGKDQLSMKLDEIEIAEEGEVLVCMGLNYTVGEYEYMELDATQTVDLTYMSLTELEGVAQELVANAYVWAMTMESTLSEILYYFT